MATFYVLPPRPCLDELFGELLAGLLPGLPATRNVWDTLSRELAADGGWPADTYLIPKDDLPDGEPVADALAEAFGLEPGDRVVEVGLPRAAGGVSAAASVR
jgi:hypothetical protein